MPENGHSAKPIIRARAPRPRNAVEVSDLILEIATIEPIQFVDLTDRINRHLSDGGVVNGTITVFSRHTTAAIKINEAEELLLEDFKQMLRELIPSERDYNHNDMSRRRPPIAPDERPNAHSHLMHLLLSTSETIPVVDGVLALGTWQRVFMVELDGPRARSDDSMRGVPSARKSGDRRAAGRRRRQRTQRRIAPSRTSQVTPTAEIFGQPAARRFASASNSRSSRSISAGERLKYFASG